MSGRSSRTRRRRELLRLLAQKAKRKLKCHRRRRSIPTEEQKIRSFIQWCRHVGLDLHPKISIGRHGSCAEIGVVALEDINKGECLAVIPRHVLLSCSTSDIGELVAADHRIMQSTTSSWVPLLIALAAECSKKQESSYWHPYLSLVPNNEQCSPPIQWAESERHRLLEGTGLECRIEQDLSRINKDFTDLSLPFMQKHGHCFSPSVQSLPYYTRLVSLVMSYSFTDSEENNFLSRTMMVPFVDLLNHHSCHHVELKFGKSSLRLMVVRPIKKGEEIMNTYGQLSNADLLHTYGFTETDNPYDEAIILVSVLKEVFLTSSTLDIVKSREERWKSIEDNAILEEDYTVHCSGKPSAELLEVVRLLHAKDSVYTSLIRKQRLIKVKFTDLSSKEKSFLRRLTERCLADFPGHREELLTCGTFDEPVMTSKEKYALTLCEGQQNCLKALSKRLDT